MPGFSVLLGATCAAAAWPLRRLDSRVIAVAFGGALAVLLGGALGGEDLFPWANLPLLALAVSGGILLGRLLPARARPMLILLLAASVLDVLQVTLSSRAAAGTGPDYTMLRLHLWWGTAEIGALDLLLAAAIGEHWRRRAGRVWSAIVAVALGLILADLCALALPNRSLPLLPFLALGWLSVEALARRRIRSMPSSGV